MIITSLSIVFSMVVIIQLQNRQTGEDPGKVQTVGSEMANCNARGLNTAFGRLGCANASKVTNRRTTSGGAVFLSIGN